jgi:hypothetical protein
LSADRTPAERARIHVDASGRHLAAAERHDEAALFWAGQGSSARADLHRRAATLERELARLEQDWAEIEETEPR